MRRKEPVNNRTKLKERCTSHKHQLVNTLSPLLTSFVTGSGDTPCAPRGVARMDWVRVST